jgi:hypothetical protein
MKGVPGDCRPQPQETTMTTRAIAFALCVAAALVGTTRQAGAAVWTHQLADFQCDTARTATGVQPADCDVAVKRGAPVVARAQRGTTRPFGGLEVIAGDPLGPTQASLQQTPAPAPPPPPPPTTSSDGPVTADKAD